MIYVNTPSLKSIAIGALLSATLGCLTAKAQTVWNVNVGNTTIGAGQPNEISTTDNFIGAAAENTANSTWNAVSSTTLATLADSTGDSAAGVTFKITPIPTSAIDFGTGATSTGDEIFKTWIKDNGNNDLFDITFGNLNPAFTYSLVIYFDWRFTGGDGHLPVTQTAGSGLSGTFNINRFTGGAAGEIGPLLQDTDPADIDGTNTTQWNFGRFNGLAPSATNTLSFNMGGVNAPVNGFQLIQIAPPPSVGDAGTSTVVAAPTSVQANGVAASTVTVSLKDAAGQPVSNKWVTLANTGGLQTATITPAIGQTTPASGIVNFQVRSSTPGTSIFTATDVTDSNLVITQTASVNFLATVPVDAALSTVTATPGVVAATGSTPTTLTVTLRDASGLPVSGKNVTLAAAPALATISPAGSVTTNTSGVATFTATSTTSATITFTATSVSDGNLAITQTAAVNFVGPGNATTSTLSSAHTAVVANGLATTTITLNLKDSSGFSVEGKTITLAGNPGNAAITPPFAVTDANGLATFSISSSTIGTEIFTATNGTDSVTIAQTATINFFNPATPQAINFNVFNLQGTPTLDDPATLTGPADGSGQTWNQGNSTALISNLLSSTGGLTNVSVTLTGNGRWVVGNPANSLNMLRVGAGQSDITQPLDLTLSGLPPDALFDVFLASARTDGIEPSIGTWSTTEETTSASSQTVSNVGNINGTTWVAGNNFVVFEKVKVNSSGQIIFSGTSGASRLLLNGFQLVPATPSAALITAFGIPGFPGVINQTAKTISLSLPTGTSLATLAPTFTLTSGTSNHTSGAPPSPSFAAQNPATYTITDTSTDPDTINNYTVTAIVAPATTTLVINLGNSPAGTAIIAASFIGSGPTNLPLPPLPPGSILRAVAVNTRLEATDNDNFAYDLSILLDPTPSTPGGDFSLGLGSTESNVNFGQQLSVNWASSAGDGGVGTTLADSKTSATWSSLGNIDLATTGLFLGNGFQNVGWATPQGATWSGTITLTYDLVNPASPYATWSGGSAANLDSNNDGIPNGVAWVLGATGPNATATTLAPTLDNSSDPAFFIFNFRRSDASAADGKTAVKVQYTSTLTGWTDALASPDIIITPSNDFYATGIDKVEVKIRRTLAVGNRLFARLNVGVAP